MCPIKAWKGRFTVCKEKYIEKSFLVIIVLKKKDIAYCVGINMIKAPGNEWYFLTVVLLAQTLVKASVDIPQPLCKSSWYNKNISSAYIFSLERLEKEIKNKILNK